MKSFNIFQVSRRSGLSVPEYIKQRKAEIAEIRAKKQAEVNKILNKKKR